MLRLENPALARMEAGEISLGVGIRHGRTVDIAQIMNVCGFDWLFIDLEHSPMTLDTAAQMSMAALGAGIAPIIRIPIGDYAVGTRLLDAGALGIVHPHIENADEARQLVDAMCYPPLGHRGVSGAIAQFGYRQVNLGEAVTELNRATLICVMLETPEAIARADEIAAVEGVDIVMIGTNDLAMALGHPQEFGHPEVVSAYETVAAACKRHGKWCGSGGVYDLDLVRRYVGMGVRFLLAAGDSGLMISAGRDRVGSLREINVGG
jgi:2-keto-3-deoxy-L-rhamnonate aldolase RhmA